MEKAILLYYQNRLRGFSISGKHALKPISIEGEFSMECGNTQDIENFCDKYLKNHFNIDRFPNSGLEVLILYSDAPGVSENIECLFVQLRGCRISLLSMSEAVAYICNRSINSGKEPEAFCRFMGCIWKISINEKKEITVEELTGETENGGLIELPDSLLISLVYPTVSDDFENKIKELEVKTRTEIAETQDNCSAQVKKYENKIAEAEINIFELQKELTEANTEIRELKNKLEDKKNYIEELVQSVKKEVIKAPFDGTIEGCYRNSGELVAKNGEYFMTVRQKKSPYGLARISSKERGYLFFDREKGKDVFEGDPIATVYDPSSLSLILKKLEKQI